MKHLCMIVVLLALRSVRSIADEDATAPTVESRYVKLVLREDLRGLAHLIDKRTGRDYAASADRSLGLYTLHFGNGPERGKRTTAGTVVSKDVKRIDDGLELEFEHKGTYPARVVCRIRAEPDKPMIHWGIEVTNRTSRALFAIEYPILTCPSKLGADSADDAIVFPQHEGILLCDPDQNVKVGETVTRSYPGLASAQFMYYFDPDGGLYCAAHDTEVHPKAPIVSRNQDGMVLSWRHEFPSITFAQTNLGYDVVWTVAGGTWQDGADQYRHWAEEHAPWCQRKISAGTAPAWLQKANLFLNYTVDEEGRFFPAQVADGEFQRYRDFFGMPIVACAFGWEKHGPFIGPDCFPPRAGDDYYVNLVRRLSQRGDHMHVCQSGFRWTARKVESETIAANGRRMRNYVYSREDYGSRQAGRFVGMVRAETAQTRLEETPWADNYLLCVGCEDMRELIGGCFAKLYAYGLSGVDLDQQLGACVPPCYREQHGHPPGAGRWQYQSMSGFLAGVRMQAHQRNRESFLGVDEPCEVYIPSIDIVHGRAFTDTRWPAAGPGGVSIPLYIYLYHDYQLNYAGWIDAERSPFGDIRYGIARALLFGMQLGVRIDRAPFEYAGDEPSTELVMLRNAARLLNRCDRYLLRGRMLHDPKVDDSPKNRSHFLFQSSCAADPLARSSSHGVAIRGRKRVLCNRESVERSPGGEVECRAIRHAWYRRAHDTDGRAWRNRSRRIRCSCRHACPCSSNHGKCAVLNRRPARIDDRPPRR